MERLNERYNIAKIGKNINELRRKRGHTIKDLSEKVGISAGKLSGMENGKGNFFEDEIVRIAATLDVPKEEILSFETILSNPDIKQLRERLQIANQMIVIGMVNKAEKILLEMEKEINDMQVDELFIELYFNMAEFYRAKQDLESAIQYYTFAIEQHPTDSESTETKIRAYNALSCIEHQKGDFSSALWFSRAAINLFPIDHPVLTIDQANAHYNAAIYYTFLQELNLALFHGKRALEITKAGSNQANQHTKFLVGIIHIVRKEYEEAKRYLFAAMKWFQRQKDLSNLYNALEYLLIISQHHPMALSDFDMDYIKEFISLPVPSQLRRLKLRCIQKVISILLGDKEYGYAGELLMICTGFEKELDPIHSHTYHLLAQLARAIGETRSEIAYLEKALSFLPENSELPEKAIILFELARITESGNSLFHKAGDLFYKHFQNNPKIWDRIYDVFPKPRY